MQQTARPVRPNTHLSAWAALACVMWSVIALAGASAEQGGNNFIGRLSAVPIDFVTVQTTQGVGAFTAVLEGNMLSIDGTFEGLNSPATAAHVHRAFKGVTESGSADSFYLNWVDWYDTSGLGENTPILAGTGSDSLIAFDDGEWVVMRVPYPLGFHPRGLDGRIDDPDIGWKGRGPWSTQAAQATWHQEGGKGERPKVAHFQLRPHPLAK